MDLSYASADREFQAEVAAFLEARWNPAAARDADGKIFVDRFRVLATEQGYLYRNIPREYGGSGQQPNPVRAQIIREEFQKVRAPMEVAIGNGMSMLVPTLLECGTDEQKRKFIPPTVTGEFRWAQGYSEPGAGSDLAALKARADLDGDRWIINGRKIWTSFAHQCTHMFALVRTEPTAPKHQGISYLLLELDQPGVELSRIRQISGQSEFCETLLTDAEAPADWIVGARGDGWRVSKSTLKHERNSIGATRSLALLKSLIELARTIEIDGAPAIENPVIRDRIFALEGYVRAQLYTGYYQLTQDILGESSGISSLTNKLAATEIGLEVARIASDILGDRALTLPKARASARTNPEQWLNQIFGSLALSIAGGTSNIQRNIIAERGLGLPREPADAAT